MSDTAVPLRSTNDQSTPPAEQSTFLFVNETGGAASYKQGNRRDVRAHVRKVAAKQFGITHKVPRKRAEALPKYVPLAIKGEDGETSKEVEHDRSCSSNIAKTRQEPPARPDPVSAARALTEITKSPYTPATDGQSAERQLNLTSCCKACGAPLNRTKLKQRLLSKEKYLISAKATSEKPNLVRRLGAGRVDPFSTLPMEETSLYSQELLDHGMCIIIPASPHASFAST
jgi:hypothetical protein